MPTIAEGTIKRLHVDQHIVRRWKPGSVEPAPTIQTSKGPIKARKVKINGPSEFIQRPEKPLSCGAKIWFETRAEIEYDD